MNRHFLCTGRMQSGRYRVLLKLLLLGTVILFPAGLLACPFCNTPTGKLIRRSILENDFLRHLVIGVLPFLVLALILFGLRRAGFLTPLALAGTVLGIGVGGFVDGIAFHQIFQFHSMLSAELPQTDLINVKVSMFWDGLFHTLTLLTTIIGILFLWRAGITGKSEMHGKLILGGAFAGWGLFNLVEGLINHYIAGLHHVVEQVGLSVYDHLFLLSGLILITLGYRLIRQQSQVERMRL